MRECADIGYQIVTDSVPDLIRELWSQADFSLVVDRNAVLYSLSNERVDNKVRELIREDLLT